MAGIVKFIRRAGRIIPIRAPLAGKNLQSAHLEVGARAERFAKKAKQFLSKSKTFSKDSNKLAAAPGGKFLHMSAVVNARSEHKLKQAEKAIKIASTLDTYKKVASGAAHVARNKGKYALGAIGATAYAHHQLNDGGNRYGKSFYRAKR